MPIIITIGVILMLVAGHKYVWLIITAPFLPLLAAIAWYRTGMRIYPFIIFTCYALFALTALLRITQVI
jgi:hypothetical protein